jgi:hypothetical protein
MRRQAPPSSQSRLLTGAWDLSGRWSSAGLVAKEAGRARMLGLVVECHDTGPSRLLSCLPELVLLLQVLFLLLAARCVPLCLSFRIPLFAALCRLCLSLFGSFGLLFVIRGRPGLFLFSCLLTAVVFGWYQLRLLVRGRRS